MMEDKDELLNRQTCANCRWLDDDGDRLACFCPDRIYKYVFKGDWCPKWEKEK